MLKDIYKKALSDGFALGAFNFDNLSVLKAIVNASLNKDFYCLACVSEGALKELEDEYLVSLMSAVRSKTNKVFFHLDHGKNFEICKKAVLLGFDSVMIDGSSLEFEKNVELTKQVVDFAHSKNVLVEAELGVLAGIEEDVKSEEIKFTNPDEAELFVKLTKVDTLAVAIGTSHGAYKFKGEPNLDFDILKQIQDKIPSTPLVLHGASSVYENSVKRFNLYNGDLQGSKGVPDDILKKACKGYNICKINTDTDLRIEFLGSVKQYLNENGNELNIRKMLKYAQDDVQKIIEHKIMMFK